ncbi:hypothetical protein GN958_ATG03209 [Phytophthora infestans]|uniref:Uncharacterized protein n=1 Tax=Phytophthora infestans TaxID=4787 RepID=A0A8S9V3S0_PHYIN|nr:hypothetical protein GN958_ATG03209 [Phytophthora infestans]
MAERTDFVISMVVNEKCRCQNQYLALPSPSGSIHHSQRSTQLMTAPPGGTKLATPLTATTMWNIPSS